MTPDYRRARTIGTAVLILAATAGAGLTGALVGRLSDALHIW